MAVSVSNIKSHAVERNNLPLTYLEILALQFLRDFPLKERWKIVDLLQRFSMAEKYTGEMYFNFQWLLTAEQTYDPVLDARTDVLKKIL